MKSLTITLAALILGAVLSTALTLPGCGPIDKGASVLVVTTERTIQTSYEAVNAFIQFDDAHRAAMAAEFPAIHAEAEQIRRTAPALFAAAWQADADYKAARTQASGNALSDAMGKINVIAQAAQDAMVALHANPTAPATQPAIAK